MATNKGDAAVMIMLMLIGFVFMFLGWAMWYARRHEPWRLWIEKSLLDPGEGLFDSNKSYTPYVRWMRYAAFITGLILFVPTPIMIDLIIGTIAAVLFVFWVNRAVEKQKPAAAN